MPNGHFLINVTNKNKHAIFYEIYSLIILSDNFGPNLKIKLKKTLKIFFKIFDKKLENLIENVIQSNLVNLKIRRIVRFQIVGCQGRNTLNCI